MAYYGLSAPALQFTPYVSSLFGLFDSADILLNGLAICYLREVGQIAG